MLRSKSQAEEGNERPEQAIEEEEEQVIVKEDEEVNNIEEEETGKGIDKPNTLIIMNNYDPIICYTF